MNACLRLLVVLVRSLIGAAAILPMRGGELERAFANPSAFARPWVYWFWMDGNVSREGITADLEAMQRAGLGGVIMMEVDVGIPRGPVNFMGAEWRALFKHAVTEAERLGLQITLNAGPGWTGSGGPWVKPEQSMQHLVASSVEIVGPTNFAAVLPRPVPRQPYFGTAGLPAELLKAQNEFYADVAILAFPATTNGDQIADLDEKALYLRHPYSSKPGVKAFLPSMAVYPALPEHAVIRSEKLLDLSPHLRPDGHLAWEVPPGRWTILRFGRTSTGANTRPAPQPGLGLESDKFDKAALEAHFDAFVGALLRELGPRKTLDKAGWTMLHIDSWEMGAQNWTSAFREAFRGRRGYDPLLFLPVMTGRVVESLEVSERFLWDIRQTAQELVVENHATHLKELGRRHGFGLSIEPYDMNPCADMTLGSVADVPMCEFWASGFDTFFTCIEASSIAHTGGRKIVAAEAFTSDDKERWFFHSGQLKTLGDWAFCAGVNRIVFHRYAHQPWHDRWPGMTMGPYGVHWERTQTWWDMVSAYHEYLARCQFLLRQGLAVADICFLVPEGAPHVFRPPASAMTGSPPDRLGYNFDGCAPGTLIERMKVKGGRLVLPDGMSYRLLVLPQLETMTPALLCKVRELVRAGATVVGSPPRKSPSLSGYPQCDTETAKLAKETWGEFGAPASAGVASVPPTDGTPNRERRYGKGRVVWSGSFPKTPSELYPEYETLANLLREAGVPLDFESDGPLRYTHRRDGNTDIYFVANRSSEPCVTTAAFRVTGKAPELWHPLQGEIRRQPVHEEKAGRTFVPLSLEPAGSVFVVFRKSAGERVADIMRDGISILPKPGVAQTTLPLAELREVGRQLELLAWQSGRYEITTRRGRTRVAQVATVPAALQLTGPWRVGFQPGRGAPDQIELNALTDLAKHNDAGVRHFSGVATYHLTFTSPAVSRSRNSTSRVFLDLGKVRVMAQVKLNGRELGTLWTEPWRAELTDALVPGDNVLEVRVANLWPNRLIGDAALPADQRIAWTTWNPFKPDAPLPESGLLGPVTLRAAETITLK